MREVLGQAAYLRTELTGLEADGLAPAPLIAEARALVEALDGTCRYDLREELEILAEKLGTDSGREFANPDPAVNAGFIVSWLQDDLLKLTALIERLTQLKPDCPLLEMLLMAGAGEMIRAHGEIRRELEPLLRRVSA